MNLFYQVFDRGMLSDGEGREVDFKDTVIFMTSNLATDAIMTACASGNPDMDALTATIRPILSKHFKPALLARMTIVPFYPIVGDALKEIVTLKLGRIASRLKQTHKMAMVVDPRVVDLIAERCTEVETGARNIDHIISGTILPKVSSALLTQMSQGPLPEKLTIGVGETGEFTYTFSS
jgi:type VI secretion system protein VasG